MIVLQVNEHNIYSYEQGSFELVLNDLHSHFDNGSTVKNVLEQYQLRQFEKYYRIRKEIVKFKKVLYHLFQNSVQSELAVRQLSTTLFTQLSAKNKEKDVSSYIEISEALAKAKGVVQAMQETRRFTKEICMTHRHPKGISRNRIANLPESMMILKMLSSAKLQLESFTGQSKELDTIIERIGDPIAPLSGIKPVHRQTTWNRYVEYTQTLQAAEVSHFILQSLIARGAVKAMMIYDEFVAYSQCMKHVILYMEEFHELLKQFGERKNSDDSEVKRLDVCINRTFCMLDGCLSVYKPIQLACQRILDTFSKQDPIKLFEAGNDISKGMKVPDSFKIVPSIIDGFLALHNKYRVQMEAKLTTYWPPNHENAPFNIIGKFKCWQCNLSFSNLWVQRGVCRSCKVQSETKEYCPYRKHSKVEKRAYCKHKHKCILDDRISCYQCRLHLFNSEEAANYILESNPAFVFLDWDQTLCNTKSGTRPMLDRHKLDRNLMDMIHIRILKGKHVAIVTRNQHIDAIENMVKHHSNIANRVGKELLVHVATAGLKRSKCDIVREVIRENPSASVAFVDDTLAEHFHLEDHGLSLDNLQRIIFSKHED